MIQANTKIYK